MRLPFLFKKRGHRSTTPKTLGLIWGMTLFTLSLAIGVGAGVTFFGAWVMPEWQALQFVEGSAEVVATRVDIKETEHGPLFRPRVQIRYLVNDTALEAWTYDLTDLSLANRAESEALLTNFKQGEKRPCWYDPSSPDTVVVVRGASWRMWMFLLLPIPFLAIGVVGLIYCIAHWTTSAERRAVRTRRLSGQELIDQFRETDGIAIYPFVPDDRDIRNSPGVRLKYRLPTVSGGWSGFAEALAASICLATGISGMVVAWSGRPISRPDVVVLAFSSGLCLLGIFAAASLIRTLRRAGRLGHTRMEISEHPLIRGRISEGVLFHSGWSELKGLEVLLACDEVAIFRQGTDVRTEVRRVYEATCLYQPHVRVQRQQPVEIALEIACPEAGPHSFKAAHNEIRWALIVRAEVLSQEKLERRFPVIVLPGAAHQVRESKVKKSVSTPAPITVGVNIEPSPSSIP